MKNGMQLLFYAGFVFNIGHSTGYRQSLIKIDRDRIKTRMIKCSFLKGHSLLLGKWTLIVHKTDKRSMKLLQQLMAPLLLGWLHKKELGKLVLKFGLNEVH